MLITVLRVSDNTVVKVIPFLTPEPNGVGEGVLGIGRVLRRRRRRRRRRRDGICVWTP